MKRHKLLAVLSLLYVTGCASNGTTAARQHQAEHGVLGGWKSTELGGRDIGDRLKEVEYIFRRDGSFVIAATLSDNTMQRYEGTYKVLPLVLKMTIQEKGTEQLPYTLEGDVLTVKDPELDSWIKFRRKSLAEQHAPVDADKPRP